MKTIKEIRIENLKSLISSHGSIAALADAIGKAPAVVSQMHTGRYFGEKSARDIERALNLPLGYMDNESTDDLVNPLDSLLNQIKALCEASHLERSEKQLINGFRKLDKSEQKTVINLVNSLSSKKT